MIDAATLFIILFGVYLLQCIAWICSGDVAFRVGWKLGGKPVRHFLSVLGGEYRLFFLNPFSPLAGPIVCEALPELRIGAGTESRDVAGQQLSRAAAEPAITIRQNQKQPFRVVGRDVQTGEALVYKAHSQAFANVLVELLEKLRNTPEAEWGWVFSQKYEEMFDISKVEARFSQYRAHSGFLRISAFLIFVFVFGIAPLEIRLFGFGRTWPHITVYLLLMLTGTSWGFLRAQKVLYPGQSEGRWQHALTFALSPLSAMRANDALLRDLCCSFHPLAVACAIMSKNQFAVEAERELRHLTYHRGPASSHKEMRAAFEAFLRDAAVDSSELLKPPIRESVNSSAYCPLCLSQFLIDSGECPDCLGVPLEKFASSLVASDSALQSAPD